MSSWLYNLNKIRRQHNLIYGHDNLIGLRRTGRTTGLIYEAIGWCLSNPDKVFVFKDHSQETDILTYKRNRYAFEELINTVKKNDLECFYFHKSTFRMVFSLCPPSYVFEELESFEL